MTLSPDARALADTIGQVPETDAPLDEQLALLAERTRSMTPEAAASVDRMAERLRLAGAGATAPAPGAPMPAFLLPDEAGRLVALEELLANGPLVVAFLRGHWCPFCQATAHALAGTERSIAAAGGSVVAITPERRRYSAALRSNAGAAWPVLSDIDNGYAMSIGLAIWVGAEVQARMEAAGRDLPRYQGSPSWLLPIPATFVLARDGVIVDRHIDPDYRQRMPRTRLLAAVRQAAERK